MSRTRALHNLQKTDDELQIVSRRLKEIAAALGESDQVTQTRKQATDAEEQLAKCRTQARNLDLEVSGFIQRIETNEQRLYGGRVTNPKELANLQEDTVSLKRWREKKEEDLLEALVAEEDAEKNLGGAQGNLAQTITRWEADQEDLVAERSQLETQQEELLQHRGSLVASIDPEDIGTYQALRQRKGGRAVVAVEDGICLGCRMPPPTSQVQQAETGETLVFCNNCGRILHLN
jgi:predicted  nucleic acid-binding Zn-ribbon protein